MKTLIECLAEAKRLPFKVRVARSGGQYTEGQTLRVNKVGTRLHGENVNQVTYDFQNESTGRLHTDWRHDSSARFELVEGAILTDAKEAALDRVIEALEAFREEFA